MEKHEQNFLLEFADLLERHKGVNFYYTTDDDGIHIEFDGSPKDCFVGGYLEPGKLREAVSAATQCWTTPPTTTIQLFSKLKNNGGCIVSSGDCSTLEIADAQARGDFTADGDGFGYVLRPHAWLKKHSRFARDSTDSCAQRSAP